MPLAKDAPNAIRNAISSRVLVVGFTKPMAAVEAIRRFEGPKNGIRFRANAKTKVIKISMPTVNWYPLA